MADDAVVVCVGVGSVRSVEGGGVAELGCVRGCSWCGVVFAVGVTLVLGCGVCESGGLAAGGLSCCLWKMAWMVS